MSMLSIYRRLGPRARIGLGASLLAWGTIGLYLSDRAERGLGLEPSEKDKQALPHVLVVEREGR